MKNLVNVRRATYIFLVAASAGIAYWTISRASRSEVDVHRPAAYTFELVPQDLAKLGAQGENGNCEAAYLVGRHHLYVSLDYDQAARYFRLASRCPHVEAMLGLIGVLRRPEQIEEINSVLASLKTIDKEAWQRATDDIALRDKYRSTLPDSSRRK